MIKSVSMTKYTREVSQGKKDPSIDMSNWKPFRSAALKYEAHQAAEVAKEGRSKGTHVATGVRRQYHPPVK